MKVEQQRRVNQLSAADNIFSALHKIPIYLRKINYAVVYPKNH